jgi:type II secretory pathway component PulC
MVASVFVSLNSIAAPPARTPAATPAPAATPQEPQVVKSVFVDRPNFGRDPFFPNSLRRGKTVQDTVVEPVANFNNIVLKGISGTAEKRLAIINNKTFEAGEDGELRISGHLTKIKIVEVREKSVVISLNGVTRELFLGSKL